MAEKTFVYYVRQGAGPSYPVVQTHRVDENDFDPLEVYSVMGWTQGTLANQYEHVVLDTWNEDVPTDGTVARSTINPSTLASTATSVPINELAQRQQVMQGRIDALVAEVAYTQTLEAKITVANQTAFYDYIATLKAIPTAQAATWGSNPETVTFPTKPAVVAHAETIAVQIQKAEYLNNDAIAARHLFISDMENLQPIWELNDTFNQATWSTDGATVAADTVTYSGSQSMVFNKTVGGTAGSYVTTAGAEVFAVTPGETYLVEAMIGGMGAGGAGGPYADVIYAGLFTYTGADGNGFVRTLFGTLHTVNGWTKVQSLVTIPAGGTDRWAKAMAYYGTGGAYGVGSALRIAYIKVRRANAASLVLDNTLPGAKITDTSIAGGKVQDNAINVSKQAIADRETMMPEFSFDEQDLSMFVVGNGTLSFNTTSLSGGVSAQLLRTNTTLQASFQGIPANYASVRGGFTYFWEMEYRSADGVSYANGVNLFIEWYDRLKAFISNASLSGNLTTSGTGFQSINSQVVAPSTARYATFIVIIPAIAPAATKILVDSLSLRRVIETDHVKALAITDAKIATNTISRGKVQNNQFARLSGNYYNTDTAFTGTTAPGVTVGSAAVINDGYPTMVHAACEVLGTTPGASTDAILVVFTITRQDVGAGGAEVTVANFTCYLFGLNENQTPAFTYLDENVTVSTNITYRLKVYKGGTGTPRYRYASVVAHHIKG